MCICPWQVAKRTGKKVYVNEDKMEIIKCLGLKEEELAYFTTNMKVCVLVAKINLCLDASRSDESERGKGMRTL